MTDDDAPDGDESGGEQDGYEGGAGDDGEPAGLSGERSSTELGPGSTASPPPGDDAASGEDVDQEEASEDAPLSDLREDVAERRARADDDFEELFTEIEVGEVDEDSVWEALSETDDDPLVEAEFVEEDGDEDREVTVVEKSLCHGCPHFADPPDTACTHDGTTIDAEVDTGHFRVVDCPIVEERRERERETTDFSAEDT